MAIDATPGGDLSNSFASLAEADGWFADRANSAWAALDVAAKEAALLRGMDYLLMSYVGLWKFTRTSATQALPFPAADVVDCSGAGIANDTIPSELKTAQFLAVLHIGLTDASGGTGGATLAPGSVKSETRTVGRVTHKLDYADGGTATASGAVADNYTPLKLLEALLGCYTTTKRGSYGWQPLPRS